MSLYVIVGLVAIWLLVMIYRRWLDHVDRAWYDEIRRRERLRILLRREREIRK